MNPEENNNNVHPLSNQAPIAQPMPTPAVAPIQPPTAQNTPPQPAPLLTQSQPTPTEPTVIGPTFNEHLGEEKKRRKLMNKIKENAKKITLVVSTLVILFILFTFIATPIQVNGISMQPTFHTGDFVLTYKLPQSWAKLSNTQYIPKLGQVIIVNDPNNNGELYIKRVVGLPGDKVTVSSGIVKVVNEANPGGFDPDNASYGKKLSLYQPGMDFSSNVENGQVFVMGDNRTPGASIDSRSSMGNIPSKEIIGQVIIQIWPLNKIKIY
jgi:signal peptidase I